MTKIATQIIEFQSTSPVWGTTGGLLALGVAVGISIHVPRVGDDSKNSQIFWPLLYKTNNDPQYQPEIAFGRECVACFFEDHLQKSGAKPLPFSVYLNLALKASRYPPGHKRPLRRNGRSCFHSDFPNSKTAGCPSPDS